MARQVYTLSLNPEETNIDSEEKDLSTELQDVFIKMFSQAMTNPTDLNAQFNTIESYYNKQKASKNTNVATVTTANVNAKTVAQINMDGEEVWSTTAPTFSTQKEDAKQHLGSVSKINETEVLIGDSENKRAIIINTETGRIMWEYSSDRFILDAQWVPKENFITIIDSEIQYTLSTITIGMKQFVIWVNNSSDPITIYSGNVSENDFNDNFNIDLYGTDFKSEVLNPGERFCHTFTELGDHGWFSYPFVNIGTVSVSNNKTSSDDYLIITEGDGLESPFTGKVSKINVWGKEVWSLGSGYITNPTDARVSDNTIIIST